MKNARLFVVNESLELFATMLGINKDKVNFLDRPT